MQQKAYQSADLRVMFPPLEPLDGSVAPYALNTEQKTNLHLLTQSANFKGDKLMNQDTGATPLPPPAIDWALVWQSTPFILLSLAWILWTFFLLIPALFGLHYAPLFTPLHNALYVLMGLVLCVAASIALGAGHAIRFAGFVASVSLLAYWF